MFQTLTQERYTQFTQSKFSCVQETQPVILSTCNHRKFFRIKIIIFCTWVKNGRGHQKVKLTCLELDNHFW